MVGYLNEIERLIHLLTRLPGIGPRSAQRIAFFIANSPVDYKKELIDVISSISQSVKKCRICHNFSNEDICFLCRSKDRDNSIICVVEKPQDLIAIENSGGFKGRYYVLYNLLSPIDNIMPEDVDIEGLIKAIEFFGVKEVLLALKSSVEGEATSLFISERLKDRDLTITRLATGLPMGGEIEYIDERTIFEAIRGRKPIEK